MNIGIAAFLIAILVLFLILDALYSKYLRLKKLHAAKTSLPNVPTLERRHDYAQRNERIS